MTSEIKTSPYKAVQEYLRTAPFKLILTFIHNADGQYSDLPDIHDILSASPDDEWLNTNSPLSQACIKLAHSPIEQRIAFVKIALDTIYNRAKSEHKDNAKTQSALYFLALSQADILAHHALGRDDDKYYKKFSDFWDNKKEWLKEQAFFTLVHWKDIFQSYQSYDVDHHSAFHLNSEQSLFQGIHNISEKLDDKILSEALHDMHHSMAQESNTFSPSYVINYSYQNEDDAPLTRVANMAPTALLVQQINERDLNTPRKIGGYPDLMAKFILPQLITVLKAAEAAENTEDEKAGLLPQRATQQFEMTISGMLNMVDNKLQNYRDEDNVMQQERLMNAYLRLNHIAVPLMRDYDTLPASSSTASAVINTLMEKLQEHYYLINQNPREPEECKEQARRHYNDLLIMAQRKSKQNDETLSTLVANHIIDIDTHLRTRFIKNPPPQFEYD